jgi:hypothetical protein
MIPPFRVPQENLINATVQAEENRIARVELVDEMRATARRMRECAERMKNTQGAGVSAADAYFALIACAVKVDDAAYGIEIDRRTV